MRRATVIQHLAFENLGTLAPVLRSAGFAVDTLHAGVDNLSALDALSPDLLIVLGGPIGVYEESSYPFLADEIKLLAMRLKAQRPTLGICLGAQLMAAALGAKVYPGTNGKEICWGPLILPSRATTAPSKEKLHSVLDPLFQQNIKLLHWHGDTFDLPAGAIHLASSAQYPNQAFAIGDYALALQFHIEVEQPTLESWYIGHTAELSRAKVSIVKLREEGCAHAPALERAAASIWNEYLQSIHSHTLIK